MAQLTYGYDIPKGVAGGKVDLACDEVVTRLNEAEDGVMKFGMGAVVGTSAGSSVKVPAAKTDVFEGVVLYLPNTEQDMNGNVVVKKDVSLGIVKHGKVWVRLATDVTPTYGAEAYVVATGADAGCFTTSAEDNIKTTAKFGNLVDGSIAVIEL